MKIGMKIFITVGTIILFMSVLPLLAIKLLPGITGIGLWFVCFFAVNPLIAVCLGALAGTEIKTLWWIPLAVAALFPPLFGIAIGEFVLDLYVYSAIYLPIGILAMVFTHLRKKLAGKKEGA